MKNRLLLAEEVSFCLVKVRGRMSAAKIIIFWILGKLLYYYFYGSPEGEMASTQTIKKTAIPLPRP